MTNGKSPATLNQILTIAAGILISVFVWGMRVESTLNVHEVKIETNSKKIEMNDIKQDNNYGRLIVEIKELSKNIVELKVELQNKANR